MSKFCESCGAQMEDNASQCPTCNAAASAVNATANVAEANNTTATEDVKNNIDSGTVGGATSPVTTSSNNKNKIIAIAAGAFAFLIFLSVVVSVLGGGYKKPLDNFCKAFNKEDAKYLVKAYPEIFVEEYEYMDEDDLEDDLEYSLDKLVDRYGKNIKLSYKINDKDKIDKDDLEELEDNLEYMLDETVKISRGWELEVEFTVKGKKRKRTKKVDVNVLKVDGKWAIVELSPDTIYYRFT